VLLAGCAGGEDHEGPREGRLELVWSLDEGQPPDEPWFADISDVDVWRDRIYVSDRGRTTILALDRNGNLLRTIGREGQGPGELRLAGAFTVSPEGNVYVADRRLLQGFSPDGESLGRLDHGWIGLQLGVPLALGDSTFVWSVIPGPEGPRGISDNTAAMELAKPLLAQVRGDQWQPLGSRSIPAEADRVRTALIDRPDQPLVRPFTNGASIRGNEPGEVLFVRESDPYTVFRMSEAGAESAFTYLQADRGDWVRVLETPFAEFMAAGSVNERPDGETVVFPTPVGPAPATIRTFYFVHTVRGMALMDNRVVVLVGVLSENAVAPFEAGDLQQSLYVVDLDEQRAVMVVPVTIPGSAWLEGALPSGELVLSVREPDPAIYVYRIVPAP
jgi:hypothetical protein